MRHPTCEPIPSATTDRDGLRLQLGGHFAPYVRGIVDRWLLVAPLANPAMLEMFRDRDAPPLRDLVP